MVAISGAAATGRAVLRLSRTSSINRLKVMPQQQRRFLGTIHHDYPPNGVFSLKEFFVASMVALGISSSIVVIPTLTLLKNKQSPDGEDGAPRKKPPLWITLRRVPARPANRWD
mmetsp:Transcript_31148/g.71765  ORF Transcript_31148/g.71765 Transcript_31148/m.71765 type:complete len:114 (+) Transcript_31148:173-514(+)